MKIGISNKINIIPVSINIIWSILLLYQFFIRIPEFEMHLPDKASYLIFGMILITGFIFFITLLYILVSNFYNKFKFYSDVYYSFMPILILFLIIFFRL